ncbi:PASTA domain-containing protein [Rathayibacter sp. AY1E4]|uniref:PASTA domain-containing protein n=1 Tax=Rathayibacter sp. AY1E4 TaxID=2080552 RepID=UPI0011B04F63|nr:PASTA domain-containing protein [Rathayibacter sp. AY1E4]
MPTTAASQSAGSATAGRDYWPLTSDLRVPQFVGMTVSDAEKLANQLRLKVEVEDDRNERSIWRASNWTVVWQEVASGTAEREGAYIELRALKTDEITNEITESVARDSHTGERTFTGTVTGFARDTALSISTVIVDGRPVLLDLVDPLAPSCGAPVSGGLDQARAVLDEQLPIGQSVLVVSSDERSAKGFIHVLPSGSSLPVIDPPADSVNERLVRSGWWAPSSSVMDGGVGVSGVGADPVAFTPYVAKVPLSSEAAAYVPPIVAAGDEVVANYVGTVGDCRRSAEVDVENYIEVSRKNEEERRAYLAEVDRRIANGEFTCRDGDGDGVCYEQ